MKRLIIAALLTLILMTTIGSSVLAGEPPESNPNIIPPHVYVTLQPGDCMVVEKTVIVNPPNPGVNPVLPETGNFTVTPGIYPPPPPIGVEFDPLYQEEVYVDLNSGEWPAITFNEKICVPPETPPGYYEATIVFPITADNGYSENLGKQVIHVNVPIGSRTLGFYKNHPCVIEQVLPTDGIRLGKLIINSASSAVKTLKHRNNPLARLRSQLLTTILNDLVFGIGNCTLDDLGLQGTTKVKDIMKIADEILAHGSTDKDYISEIQDLLDEINNSNLETPLPQWISDACD